MKRFLCLLALIVAPFVSFGAQSVTLAWDANPPEDNVVGYRLYYGSTTTGEYTASIDISGGLLQTPVVDLVEGRTYYFALTAYNSCCESLFSDEVVYTVPRPPVKPARLRIVVLP